MRILTPLIESAQTVIPEDEIRRWLRGHIKRGQGAHAGRDKAARDLPTLAMLRSINWIHQPFYDWLNGNGALPARQKRDLTRFIRAWDAGLLEFTKIGQKRELHRVTTPRKMPPKFQVEIGGRFPRLKIVGRNAAPTSIRPMIDTGRK